MALFAKLQLKVEELTAAAKVAAASTVSVLGLNHSGRFSPGVLPLSSSSHEETEVPKDTLRQRYKFLTPGERSQDLAGIHALILGMSRERWIADP